jgi:hypothetical protein
MTEPTNIVPFRQPDAIDDPPTEVLRAGARQLLAQAVELEAAAFLAAQTISGCRTGGRAWCGTAMVPSARFRPGSDRCQWRG